MSRVVGIISGKGGVGKTTLTANLSVALASKFSKKVTVVDCNLTTSHLGMHFGIFFYPKTFNDFLKGVAEINDVIFPHGTGVNILPASLNVSDLVGINIFEIREKLQSLPENDFILLDTAPGFGKEALSAIRACNEALLITTPDLPSVTDVLKAKNILNQMNVSINGVVVNKVMGKKFELSVSEIEETLELPIIGKIPFTPEFSESLSNKTPLVAYNEYSKASREIFKIAAYMANEHYKEPPMLRIFLSRIFKV
ncbi:MAG: P-loop NTPase [Candidatus Aenigmatarchaeota archaeon]